ncbi:alpha-glucosidase [Arthrobacter sp. zg-Y820]|uniref:alpha-glucosidase n=1 Tax=unclassified Arthrobacter TaxID=235627 RepID=UPI001E489C15|nr:MULTISPECIES: alpha-glucosidase [unclassified Arthrobacter]MCC9196736.1 alpha-glucosidase [Arthrobacter sp. zg-Y820]MDK1279598.1 alpha-glucosidase [Arthrobacter sp. zg.Y820]WIB08030.1 alpha-glucosidase [Arthrobacter sp. zg-Y820]
MRNPYQPAWWTNAVVYQIYTRSFADSSGDGVGDLTGIINRLDYLRELGVDVLWLSPIHESPQYDNGYDISNYRRIDELYGTEEEFDRMLAEVHRRGMKLIMDLVVNHTSDQHSAFKVSSSSRSNESRDSYFWRDPRRGFSPDEPGAEPNNWGSIFGGSAWTYHPGTEQYYLHLFSPHQPDLNWESTRVRRRVYDMMNWWLDRGIDGFRMDAINFISKRPSLPDSPVGAGGMYANGAPSYVSGPRVHEFLQEMMRAVFNYRDTDYLVVGETDGVTVDEAVLFTDALRGELDMVFQFEHMRLDRGPGGKWDPLPMRLQDLKTIWNRWQRSLSDRGWNSLYLGNHDQPRAVSRFGDDTEYRYESATLWATLQHLQRGTPYIYQGEEIGMTNAGFTSLEQYRDLETLAYYDFALTRGVSRDHILATLNRVSRDNARTPMQWDDGPNAGFTTGTPWIDVNANYRTVNAAADRAAENSVFRYYQRLIALRHASQVVSLGDFELMDPSDPVLFAFRRRLGNEELAVMCNVSGGLLTVPTYLNRHQLVLGNYSEPGDPDVLRPWETRVHSLSSA